MSNWTRSILTYIDLIGVKDSAMAPDGRATDLMRRMHTLVSGKVSHGMPNHDHCYIWNDSVLLLAYLDLTPKGKKHEADVIKEADALKKDIDQICESYAIAVKGLVFPDEAIDHIDVFQRQIADQPRVIKLKTSSYAMGNCFLIEKQLRHLKRHWYIDSRIAEHLSTDQALTKHTVEMLPGNQPREVYVYSGYLW